MKIRNCFVSNSSSASYIVKIYHVNTNAVIDVIYGHLEIDTYIEKVDESLVEWTKYMNEEVSFARDDMCKRRVLILSELQTKLKDKNIDNREKIIALMEHCGVSIVEHEHYTALESFTSMHNDVGSSMSEMMKEIVVILSFETKFNLECIIDED